MTHLFLLVLTFLFEFSNLIFKLGFLDTESKIMVLLTNKAGTVDIVKLQVSL